MKPRPRTRPARFAALAGLALAANAAFADSAPPDFDLRTYCEGLAEPVAMEFAPDGRLFVAERLGRVRIVDPIGGVTALHAGGWPADAPLAQIDVFSDNENGLLGLALDPNFEQTGYVYLFATVSRSESQILRVRAAVGESVTADATPVVIRDHLPTRGVFHSGGGLKFGPDGMLYFSIGDNLVDGNAQDMNTLSGKISRITPDGASPPDNPFKTPTGAPRATYALGLRNPFRFCFAPDGRLFACDVGSIGPFRREEINVVRAGDNLGWPLREGTFRRVSDEPPDATFVDPLLEYSAEGASPVGIVYYTGKNFPVEYQGNLFHLEYVLNRVYRVQLDGDRAASHTLFVEASGGPVDLVQGPDGCLYYCEIAAGRIRRISHRSAGDVPSSTVPEPDTDAAGPVPSPAPAPCGLGALGAALAVFCGLLTAKRNAPRPQ